MLPSPVLTALCWLLSPTQWWAIHADMGRGEEEGSQHLCSLVPITPEGLSPPCSSDLSPCLLGAFWRSAFSPCIPVAGLQRHSFVCRLAGENCFPGWRVSDRGAGPLPSCLTQQAVGLGDSIRDEQPMTAQLTQKEREISCVPSCAEPQETVH